MMVQSELPASVSHLLRWLRTEQGDQAQTPPPPLSGAEWLSLVDQATRQGVAPILHHRVSTLTEQAPPAPALLQLQNVFLHSQLKNSTLPNQVAELAESAAACGVQALVLKGAHLANAVYPEPALRPMEDIDLLLRPEDSEEFRACLLNGGYRQVRNELDYESMHHERPLWKTGAFTVEVHRRLSRYERRLDVDLEGIWTRATKAKGFGGHLLFMSREDLLLHLCTHSAYDDRFQMGLLSLCDIDAVVRHPDGELNWTFLVATANADGRAPYVYVVLRMAQEALGTPIPEAADELAHTPTEDEIVPEALAHILDSTGDAPVAVQRLERASGLSDRSRALATALFPPPDRMREIYSLKPGSMAVVGWYLLRPFDLLFRWGSNLGGMILGSRRGRLIRDRERRRRLFNRWVGRYTHSLSSEDSEPG